MFSSQFAKRVAENSSTWKTGLAIVTAGTVFKVCRCVVAIEYIITILSNITHLLFCCTTTTKVAYFDFSRGIMVDHMETRHLQATEHLKDRRDLASKMAKEREDKAPPLTPEQKKQLQQYLELMKAKQPDVWPRENGRFDR